MPMKSKLAALNLFCKAMLYTGKRTSDPDANLYLSEEAKGLARRENCMLAPTLRLAARSYNWIRLLSQSAQPNLPLLAEAEMASLLSPTEPPPHIKHYEAERSSLTLQMILETVHIYTEEETMEPDDFKLAALIISQTLYNLGMGGQTVRDIVNGAAQHLRWILPSDSTRVLNGIHLCLFPSDISPWPREADTNPHTQSDEHALGILDAEIHMLQRASKIYRTMAMVDFMVARARGARVPDEVCPSEPWDVLRQDQAMALLSYAEHLTELHDLLTTDAYQKMRTDLRLGRTWLSRPITASELASLEAIWHNTTIPESFAKLHLTLQLKGQIAAHLPEDSRAQDRLLTILSPLENDVLDQAFPWILAFKMLTPERRMIFRYALLTAAGPSATAPVTQAE